VSGIGLPDFFDLETLPARPWKNGAGLTREIAAHPPGAGLDDFDWRVSVAQVVRDGPFSAFPGVDRCIVLLRGDGLRLHFGAGAIDHVLDTPGSPFVFPGEQAVEADLLGGATSDFNVMTRRGRWHAEVATLRAAQAMAAADTLLVLCCAGEWQVGSLPLSPSQGLLWRATTAALQVEPTGAHAAPWLIAVRLCHDRTP
jgi:uncharacterized protein